jgi:hypothetical protein
MCFPVEYVQYFILPIKMCFRTRHTFRIQNIKEPILRRELANDILGALLMWIFRFHNTLLLRTLIKLFISFGHGPDSRYLIRSELVITEVGLYRVNERNEAPYTRPTLTRSDLRKISTLLVLQNFEISCSKCCYFLELWSISLVVYAMCDSYDSADLVNFIETLLNNINIFSYKNDQYWFLRFAL